MRIEATPQYRPDDSGETWWCNSHQRPATHLFRNQPGLWRHECDPQLGGILLPCSAVNLTGIAEVA